MGGLFVEFMIKRVCMCVFVVCVPIIYCRFKISPVFFAETRRILKPCSRINFPHLMTKFRRTKEDENSVKEKDIP